MSVTHAGYMVQAKRKEGKRLLFKLFLRSHFTLSRAYDRVVFKPVSNLKS